MRTLANYKTARETLEEQAAAKRLHPSRVLLWRDIRAHIHTGTSDNLHVCHDRDYLYVITRNYSFQYCGLQIIDKKTGEQTGEAFLYNHEQITETLGKQGLGLTACTIAKRLAEYC